MRLTGLVTLAGRTAPSRVVVGPHEASLGRGASFEVHRAGDCPAPQRGHAAVIEGERTGAAL